ncbi:hypothetical protein PFAG_00109 [Plasmodium falciparum Santa Lucia]|uniref:Uncharacterized protein n=7 Tax=Plasmodium falciparum TaxID=5833 RepID=W4J7F6_PLAFP|nr:hypothetical protein PFFVO_00113 [Plasmodium falciparum Vietnam Oak-Knoll (FVO)]ETW39135.1 hypothetical protein PFTANZ_00137 [Plasmodium falciparum Tanzania (2000708)]ETW45606.1 hypothetical protein PFNF135_00126 [Plasmodium falciparum NF135/5.C10]ETW57964.1 hypothetical protein PFUGPA_00108 [Plasmodium falciparum Palo Alto/Uganda]ETW64087.1 hypothetical protein PFMC_00111 [Plasmodium falciparum CAMP/Malaysia]EUR82560.1 hypothetical protein PFBG_00123 [Plasmodium falciparum 7G8]EUT94015.1 
MDSVTILYYAMLIIFYILFDGYLKKYILKITDKSVSVYNERVLLHTLKKKKKKDYVYNIKSSVLFN